MSEQPTLRGIQASQIIDLWPQIGPLLQRIAIRSEGRTDVVSLVKAIDARDMQLWAAVVEDRIKAIATTELVNYPLKRVGRFVATSGEDIEEWIGYVLAIEAWAKQQGCTGMEAVARKGLERIMKPFGWHSTHSIIEKDF